MIEEKQSAAEVEVQKQLLAINTMHRTPIMTRRAALQKLNVIRDTANDDVSTEPDEDTELGRGDVMLSACNECLKSNMQYTLRLTATP